MPDLETGAEDLFFGVTGFIFAGVLTIEGGLVPLLAPLTSLREEMEVRLLTDLLAGFFGGVSTESRELHKQRLRPYRGHTERQK